MYIIITCSCTDTQRLNATTFMHLEQKLSDNNCIVQCCQFFAVPASYKASLRSRLSCLYKRLCLLSLGQICKKNVEHELRHHYVSFKSIALIYREEKSTRNSAEKWNKKKKQEHLQ